MTRYPASMERLIRKLSRLPGIGEKTATRLALYLLQSKSAIKEELAAAILDVAQKVGRCEVCHNLAEGGECRVCASPARDASVICVVESEADLMAMEEAGAFKGRYHVLLGTIDPLAGIGPDDLTIPDLIKRVEEGGIKEVVLALNPTTQGEATSAYLCDVLKKTGVSLTRIAYGLPAGGDLKYADKVTIQRCLDGRTKL
jgi:recombination protein RecR